MADLYTVALDIDTSGGTASVRSLGRVLDDLADKGESTVGKLKSSFVGLAAATGLTILGAKLLKETVDSQNAMSQLEARVKSTGAAAGQSVAALDDMSKSLQQVTTFSDEATKGAESMLLTFTKVKGDTFVRATKDIQDLATAMGGDLQGAAIQVGKALQDPETGMLALRRSGVSFSEAQQQVIKDLFNGGQVAQAQALILKELEKEFGGAAEAARNTLGGALKGLENDFGDVFEAEKGTTSGTVSFINAIGSAVRWLGTMSEWMKSAAIAATGLAAAALLVQGAMVTMTAVQGSMWLFSITAAFGTAAIAGTGFAGVIAGITPLLTRMTLAAGPIALLAAAFGVLVIAIKSARMEMQTAEDEAVGASRDLYLKQAIAYRKKYGVEAARKIYKDVYTTPTTQEPPESTQAGKDAIRDRTAELDKQTALNAAYKAGAVALSILGIQKDADAQKSKDATQFHGEQLTQLNALTDGLARQKIAAAKLAEQLKFQQDTGERTGELDKIKSLNAAYNDSDVALSILTIQKEAAATKAKDAIQYFGTEREKMNALTDAITAQRIEAIKLAEAKKLAQDAALSKVNVSGLNTTAAAYGVSDIAGRRAESQAQLDNAIAQGVVGLDTYAAAEVRRRLETEHTAQVTVDDAKALQQVTTQARLQIATAQQQAAAQYLVGDAADKAKIAFDEQNAVTQAKMTLDGQARDVAIDAAHKVAAAQRQSLDLSKSLAPWKGLLNNIENGVSKFASDLFTKPSEAFAGLVDSIKQMWAQLIADLAKREFEKVLLPKIAGLFGLNAGGDDSGTKNVTAGTIMKTASAQMLQAAGIMANVAAGGDVPVGGPSTQPGGAAANGGGFGWAQGLGAAGAGAAIGYGVGSSTQNRGLGALGGAASGALAGYAIGGPVGAAIGGIAGAVGGFIGAGNAAKKAAKQMRELQDALAINFAAYKAQITGDTLGAAIAQSQAQLKDILNQINAAYSGKKNERVREQKRAEATALENQNEQQIREQFASDTKAQQEDYQVRTLRAQGKTKEADDLAFAEQQQREYAAAVKAGADATTLAALSQAQAAEKTAYATKATKDLTEALSNAPAGFKAAKDRWMASLSGNPNALPAPNIPAPTPPALIPGVDTVGPFTPSASLNVQTPTAPKPTTSPASTLAAVATQAQAPAGDTYNITGPLTFTLPMGTTKEQVQALFDEIDKLSLRGGTNQLAVSLRGR